MRSRKSRETGGQLPECYSQLQHKNKRVLPVHGFAQTCDHTEILVVHPILSKLTQCNSLLSVSHNERILIPARLFSKYLPLTVVGAKEIME